MKNVAESAKKRPKKEMEVRIVAIVINTVKKNQPKMSAAYRRMHTYQKVAKSDVEFFRIIPIGGFDIEPRNEDDSVTNPEQSVGAECDGSKSLSAHKFPHSSNELTKPSIGESC